MIKKFNDYIKEVSGTELVGNIGPGYGDTSNLSKLDKSKTKVYELDGVFFTIDDYQEYVNIFLKSGGNINQLSGNYKNDIFFIKSYLKNNI
jgi:hypothetical protein